MLVVPWEVPCCCSDADLAEWYPEKLMTPEDDICWVLQKPNTEGTVDSGDLCVSSDPN